MQYLCYSDWYVDSKPVPLNQFLPMVHAGFFHHVSMVMNVLCVPRINYLFKCVTVCTVVYTIIVLI